MINTSPLYNRLNKNFKKLESWLKQYGIEAYRLYDKDIPEYPFQIDIYKNYCVVYEKGSKDVLPEVQEAHHQEVRDVLKELFNPGYIAFKSRLIQEGKKQYTSSRSFDEDFFEIGERPFKFWVNLRSYLDTGLFLDHRILRDWLTKECKNKKVLNLYCYTGSLSVASAVGGATVTSVDLSKTYLDWARNNFELNKLKPDQHRFLNGDTIEVLNHLIEEHEQFDLIVLDPPSFSNSKKMDYDFDLEEQHPILIDLCAKLLAPNGKIYFSNNKKKFKLDENIKDKYLVRDLTAKSIPKDFERSTPHVLFEIKLK
jgi:23S rRNA (cytosine1962-C5)-methyltransferase